MLIELFKITQKVNQLGTNQLSTTYICRPAIYGCFLHFLLPTKCIEIFNASVI